MVRLIVQTSPLDDIAPGFSVSFGVVGNHLRGRHDRHKLVLLLFVIFDPDTKKARHVSAGRVNACVACALPPPSRNGVSAAEAEYLVRRFSGRLPA